MSLETKISRRELLWRGIKGGSILVLGNIPLLDGCLPKIIEERPTTTPGTIDEIINHPRVRESIEALANSGVNFSINREETPTSIAGNYGIKLGTSPTFSYFNNDWFLTGSLGNGEFKILQQTPDNHIDITFFQPAPHRQTGDASRGMIRGKEKKFTIYSVLDEISVVDGKECRAKSALILNGERKENWDIFGDYLSVPIDTPDKEICNYVSTYCVYQFNRKLTDRDIYELIDRYDREDREFYRAIVRIESADDQNAISPAGARGLMQIMPGTWADMTSYPFDSAVNPEKNVEAGIRYYQWIENYLSSRVPNWSSLTRLEEYRLMAAAYNGGIGRLEDNAWDISRMPLETRNYVTQMENNIN